MNSLERKLQKRRESEQLIRNLNIKLNQVTKTWDGATERLW